MLGNDVDVSSNTIGVSSYSARDRSNNGFFGNGCLVGRGGVGCRLFEELELGMSIGADSVPTAEPEPDGTASRSGDTLLGFLFADADESANGGTREADDEDSEGGIEPDATRRSRPALRGPEGGILPLILPDQVLVGAKGIACPCREDAADADAEAAIVAAIEPDGADASKADEGGL